MVEPPPFTRARVEAIVEDALARAGAAGVLPTPLDAVAAVAGVRAVADIGELPGGVRTPGRRLLGALWFEERTVFLERAQSAPRRRFTTAHELVHALCPWHEAVLREDTEDELFRTARAAIEAEANLGAGLLMFQGRRFGDAIAPEPTSLAVPLALAERYGASRHAAVHHYVHSHPRAVALLVAGRFPARDGTLPVWRSVESATFRRRFGRAAERFAGGLPPGGALRELAEAARGSGTTPASPLALRDRGGRVRRCTAEAHYNRHAFLVLVAAPGERAAGVREPASWMARTRTRSVAAS